jgi:hypothetical protein
MFVHLERLLPRPRQFRRAFATLIALEMPMIDNAAIAYPVPVPTRSR